MSKKVIDKGEYDTLVNHLSVKRPKGRLVVISEEYYNKLLKQSKKYESRKASERIS